MDNEAKIQHVRVKAVILAGNRDFGRCTLASRLHTALWPVGERPALEHLLYDLYRQGVTEAVVCANGDSSLLKQAVTIPQTMDVEFLNETLPVGTAGCLRDAADGDANRLYMLLHGNITSPPDVKRLLATHDRNRSSISIMLSPRLKKDRYSQSLPEIYICDPSVLEYIPREGYFDMKEGLIPLLIRDYKIIRTAHLPRTTGIFRNKTEYLRNIAGYLHEKLNQEGRLQADSQLLIESDAQIGADCQFYGPVRIMKGVTVADGTIVFGPVVIRENVRIGRKTMLSNCILWDRSIIGDNCRICDAVVDYDAVVPAQSKIENTVVVQKPYTFITGIRNRLAQVKRMASLPVALAGNSPIQRLKRLPVLKQSSKMQKMPLQKGFIAALLLGFFLWAYWPQVQDLLKIWRRSDEYSGGFLVPFLAAYVLWARRDTLKRYTISTCWWGLGLFAAAQAMRFFGLYYMYASAERLSLVLTIAAVVLFIFGWRIFRTLIPVVLFLLLMLPFPQSVHTAITLPLQNLATKTAVFFLETLGYSVIREGNIIRLGDTYVAVAEACNGLRMVTSFFIIITLVALLIQRNGWEKLILIASGVPIALLCNSIRLTLTAIAFTMPSLRNWETFFHDFGGYAMMPLALVIVLAELWFLKTLLIEPRTNG